MNRSSLLVALTLGVAVAAAAATANRAGEQEPRDTSMNDTAPSSASIYHLNSKWTTQNGASVGLASFAGKPLVAAMGYTTCRDICPAVVADMMWIEKRLPLDAADRVRFAFFSLDSEADTPERLRLYAEGHGLDLTHWTLLQADDDATRELAAALGVGYRPNGQGGFDHAAVISLLDEKGEVVFQQPGTQASSDELLMALNTLLEKRN
jgi:protein SCO1